MTLYLYGDPTFANTQRRNQVGNYLNTEANVRGFKPAELEGYGPGAVSTTINGVPALKCCWTHTDLAILEKAHEDLRLYIESQGSIDGQFSTLNTP